MITSLLSSTGISNWSWRQLIDARRVPGTEPKSFRTETSSEELSQLSGPKELCLNFQHLRKKPDMAICAVILALRPTDRPQELSGQSS